MKYAYCWNSQSGTPQLFRLELDESGARSYYVYRLSADLPADHSGPPPANDDEHWALVLGPMDFPEPRDFEQERLDEAAAALTADELPASDEDEDNESDDDSDDGMGTD
jgi:hypothetical protein